jgi:ABC-type histidine transport system ATPase subunit
MGWGAKGWDDEFFFGFLMMLKISISAYALAMQPTVMLFDEPTSALDPELVSEVVQVIRQLALEKRTMIMVTHEMALAREISSNLIFLHNGRIEEQGPPELIMGNPKSDRLRQFLGKF